MKFKMHILKAFAYSAQELRKETKLCGAQPEESTVLS
jgi:hypothetical protein